MECGGHKSMWLMMLVEQRNINLCSLLPFNSHGNIDLTTQIKCLLQPLCSEELSFSEIQTELAI